TRPHLPPSCKLCTLEVEGRSVEGTIVTVITNSCVHFITDGNNKEVGQMLTSTLLLCTYIVPLCV
ncbi:MAG: hypothetical protein ACKPKO_20125, partial [Candidatus Fonsibacter sp.]